MARTGLRDRYRRGALAASAVALGLASGLLTGCGGDGRGSNGAGSSRLSEPADTGRTAKVVTAENDRAASASTTTAAPGAPATTIAAGVTGAAARTTVTGPGRPDERRQPVAINPWVDPAGDPLSTFALDVDTGSYALTRASLERDQFPSPDVVRPEEFVNALDQGYRRPESNGFAINIDGAPTPFVSGGANRVVRVGLATKALDAANRKAARLTFVIDVSGSMADPGKLDLVKVALGRMVDQLRADDRVAIVVYGDNARTVLEPVAGSERARIRAAIDRLKPEGSTNAEAGILAGYRVAREMYEPKALNRLALASDGVANVGATTADAINRRVAEEAAQGVGLVSAGFGFGVYNDALLERLADTGDGFYSYIDDEQEAERVFVEELPATLQTAALEAKAQVRFDPAVVRRYRLIGFENRAVADSQFRNDAVDGGEVGAGHTATALYEVELAPAAASNEPADANASLGTVTVRWLDPDSREPVERAEPVRLGALQARFDTADVHLQLDAAAAALAEVLRGSPHAAEVSLAKVAEVANAAAKRLDSDRATGLAAIATKAAALRR